MKTFIFDKQYKSGKYTVRVWRVKNNRPLYIGCRIYSSNYYRGHDHEAMQVIIDTENLPTSCMTKPKYGYIVESRRGKDFNLIELY